MVLGVMFFTPGILFAQNSTDSVVLQRVFNYQRNFGGHVEATEENVYLKYSFVTERRNVMLFLIPNMYSIARDERAYLGESYCRIAFRTLHDYRLKRQLSVGNIGDYSKAFPTALELLTPNFYDECLYERYILSPFHRVNQKLYRYKVNLIGNGLATVKFTPRIKNTQLVEGTAYVNYETGCISTVELRGEYDTVDFKLSVQQGGQPAYSPKPKHSELEARFDFAGNHIRSNFEMVFDCPTTLPDSVRSLRDMALMDSLRPVALEPFEKAIYQEYCKPAEPDTTRLKQQQEQPRKRGFWKRFGDFLWDDVGGNLFTSIRAENKRFSFRLSPLLNPQYLSYSRRLGISYKIKLRARYNFSPHRYLTSEPQVGYNFKFRELYYTLPLRMTYNPKRQGYAEVIYGNGNRITNYSVLETLKKNSQDTTYNNDDLDNFTDRRIELKNNIEVFDWLTVTTSLSYHLRKAQNAERMRSLNLPTKYRSFSPILTLLITPWGQGGPLFMLDWERGMKGVLHSDIKYERWEVDAVWKMYLQRLSMLNLRVGGGFYTDKSTNYFVDFANFHDNNVPGGWDDDWTGQFQLLDSRWYNASRYYARAHVSYESPFLMATWLPLVGKYIETERLYASALLIDHTRPYYELGYGLTNRYFSAGVFASFLNASFQELGVKITFELFRKW